MKKLICYLMSFLMCLQCVTVSALEDTSEEKSWEEIYQEVYEYALENDLEILPDGGIVLWRLEEPTQSTMIPGIQPQDYVGDGNGGYGNVTMQVIGVNGIYYYWSHIIAQRYIDSERAKVSNIVMATLSGFTASIRSFFTAYVSNPTPIQSFISGFASYWFTRSLEDTKNLFTNMCNDAQTTLNSTYSDQGILVYWKSDYSNYIVSKQ